MSPNDYAAVLGSVTAMIVAIGGLAVWREKKEPSQSKPENTGDRLEDHLHRIEGKVDILMDRVKR